MNRIGSRVLVICVVGVGVVLYNLFFVDSAEVREFNDGLVDLVQESDLRFHPISDLIYGYLDGGQSDVTKLSRMQVDLLAAVKGDSERLNSMTVPDDDLCREFHRSCVDYLENSLALAGKYSEVIDYIRVHNPASKAEDFETVNGMIATYLEKDEKLMATVGENQERMANKFDFRLE